MRAARYHGRGDIRVEEVDDPVAGDGELLLRVEAVGICGTDAHEFASGPHQFPVGGPPHPVTGHHGPLIPGHELAGTVVACGPGVEGFAEGDLVVSGAGVSCGSCHWCDRGRTNLCADYSTVGLQRNGGLAQFVVVPASTVVAVGDFALTPDAAALAQPMAIAVHAVRQGRLEPGDVAVVIGVGGIGALMTYAAVSAGATVVVSDPDADRRAVAQILGARHVADPAGAATLGQVLDGEGWIPTVVYEASGSATGLQDALAIARPGSRVVLVGRQDQPRQLDLYAVSLDELELIGTQAHVRGTDLPEALRLLDARSSGWADLAPTALPLDHLVDDGIRPLVDGTATQLKTLIDPWVSQPRATRM